MAIQSQPTRIPEPFAGSGTKNTIPATNATPSASQAASWASGFPPECSQPISAGGCPVPRNDMNGIMNQLSQDFAFRQDGGIWEWSALADYDTQRMVRGSDGILYWSVQASGPNIASGAVDPTTDDGTYWGTTPMQTPDVLDRSHKLANTQWVQNAFGNAPLYVDPTNGDDANDGLSQADALKSIAKALELADSRIGAPHKIYLAADAYTEDINLVAGNIIFILQGNVSLSGSVLLSRSSYLDIDGDNGAYKLSITAINNNCIYIDSSSAFIATCSLDLTVPNDKFGILAGDSSYCRVSYIVNIYGSPHTGVSAYDNSVIKLLAGIKENVACTNFGVFANSMSWISISGNVTLASSNYGAYASESSVVNMALSSGISNSITGVRSALYAESCSLVQVNLDSCTLDLNTDSVNGMTILGTRRAGVIHIVGPGSTVTMSGKASVAVAAAGVMSIVELDPSLTLAGTPTGARYFSAENSFIYTGGGGPNRIPGTAAGGTANGGGYY